MIRLTPYLLLAASLAGCGYSPPHRYNLSTRVLADSTADLVAIAVAYKVMQMPEGLLAFPDGGKPRIREDAAELTICDESKRGVRRAALLRPFQGVRTAFEVLLSAWGGDTLYVSLSGYDRELTGPDQRLLRRYYGFTSHATVELAQPPPARSASGGAPRAFCRGVIDSVARETPPGRDDARALSRR